MQKVVFLNSLELEIIRLAALARDKNNESAQDRKVGKQAGDFTSLNGFAGEFAFCKAFGLFPDFSLPVYGRPDADANMMGGSWDIKTTHLESGHLLVPQWKIKKPCDYYALVTGNILTDAVFTVRGWASSAEVFDDNLLREMSGGYAATYALPQAQLHEFSRHLFKETNDGI